MSQVDPDFAAYVAARQEQLLRAATLMCGDVHQAQDLLQEAMIKLALRWDEVRNGHPDAYVRRILYHDSVSWWRKLRRERLTDTLPETADPDPTDTWVTSRQVHEVLQQMPARQRAVLILRYFEDLTEAQTAEVMEISVGTVKSQAHRGFVRMRQLLGEQGEGPGRQGAARARGGER